jgi:hypothetical protein
VVCINGREPLFSGDVFMDRWCLSDKNAWD